MFEGWPSDTLAKFRSDLLRSGRFKIIFANSDSTLPEAAPPDNPRRDPLTMRVGPAYRFLFNSANMARRQDGWGAATRTALGLVWEESRKLPVRRLRWRTRRSIEVPVDAGDQSSPEVDLSAVRTQLAQLGIDVIRISLDPLGLARHTDGYRYPRFYGGGSVATGGVREWRDSSSTSSRLNSLTFVRPMSSSTSRASARCFQRSSGRRPAPPRLPPGPDLRPRGRRRPDRRKRGEDADRRRVRQ